MEAVGRGFIFQKQETAMLIWLFRILVHVQYRDIIVFFQYFQNANLLSAVLCLIKELDYTSLEVVEMAVRCRMEELDD